LFGSVCSSTQPSAVPQ
jgi:hypothetical protein